MTERKQILRKQVAVKSNVCSAKGYYVDPNTLTAEESYRINGFLSKEHIEALLDIKDVEEKAVKADSHVLEAQGQFPDEDFLQDIISDFQTIVDRMRGGDNKDDLQEAINALTEIQNAVYTASKDGMKELEKARALLP